jgi:hypothetical protein
MARTQATTDINQIPSLSGIGIRAILHLFQSPDAGDIDTTVNLLYGCKIDSMTKGGTSIEQVEISSEDIEASFASGKATGGDVTITFTYDPTMGIPPLVRPVAGITYSPQAVLWLGMLDPAAPPEAPALIPFIEIPVNISEFGEINMPKSQPATSSMKFKISGKGTKTKRAEINGGNDILYKGSAQ